MTALAEDKQIVKKLGTNIARIRNERGITQEKLAELADLSRRSVQSLEGGERWPRPSTLKAVSRVLKVSFDALFKGIS